MLNPLGAPDASAFDSSTLAQMGGMHINQVVDVAEMVTGCEAKNRYTCHMWSPGQVRRKTLVFEPFYTQNDHFTKTGSRQTQGKL